MKNRVVVAVWASALAAGAQQGSDKPSPVPRRPVRPSFASTLPGKPSQPSSLSTNADRNGSTRESESERSSTAADTIPETGTACFFSSSANGRLTGSGSRLNSEDFVAAHPRFPLGSWVRVRHLANGQTVDVRIVDRFPESSKRVINLSEAAARKLGFIKAGTAQVELELIETSPSAAREQL